MEDYQNECSAKFVITKQTHTLTMLAKYRDGQRRGIAFSFWPVVEKKEQQVVDELQNDRSTAL